MPPATAARSGPKKAHATSPPTTRRSGSVLPPLAELLDSRGPFLVPLLLLIVARLVWWIWLPQASEDAYITFRYARNLATNHQLVFNPGERVMGFSSPVWTLWTALGYALTHAPVVWTRITSVLADLGTLLVVGRLLSRTYSRASATCFTFFFAAWPYFSAVAVSGMETSALLFMIVLTATLTGAGSPITGPALAAVALWRPEGVVAAAVLMPGARLRDRLFALALFAVGVLVLSAAFGSPVPQSVMAKASLYGTPGPWGGRFWWDWLLPIPLSGSSFTGEGTELFPLAVLFLPAVLLGVPALWRERATPLARATMATLAIWLGYVALGVAYFFWYLVVPLGGLAIVAAIGLPRVVRSRAAYAACAVLVVGTWFAAHSLYVGRSQNEFFAFGQTGQFLRHYAQPGESVMLEPIGMVGYDSPLRIIDEVGLVSPAVAKRRPQGPGWYTDIVASERPDWLVVRRGVLRSGAGFAGAGAPFRSPAERDTLFAGYEMATVVDDVSGDAAMVVFHRRPAAQGVSR
jgi:arabinofuranosyltransferase